MLFDFGLSSQILGYRVFDICQRLLARLSLGVTTGQIVAPNNKAFVGFDEGDAIVSWGDDITHLIWLLIFLPRELR